MDLKKYTKGVDVWEGQLEIDEQVLIDGGVDFMAIRINDMNGGHHVDINFVKQWAEAVNFIRFPYFVYNPWVDGAANYNYLRSILPAGVTVVGLDVEVKYPNYSPLTYAQQVESCINTMMAYGLTPIVYTGKWFLTYLSYWVALVHYWWARYPYALYPSTATHITWAQLDEKLRNVSWYLGSGLPGPCRLWQCSGDRYILPGTSRPIDINVFQGTPLDMIHLYGFSDIQVPVRFKPAPIPVPITLEEKVNKLWAAHPELQ